MNLLLYPHGGSGNHGCEAIVRSTLKITGANAILYSNAIEEDEKYQLNKLCTLKDAQQPISRKLALYWKALFQNKVLGVKDAYDVVAFNPIFERSSWADFAFSIGGDNYCYGTPTFIYLINRELRKRNVKTVLWGCSVEPDAMQGEMLDDLKGYTHIFARESLTYEAMKAKGIEQVSLFPDPAFLLERKDLPLPEGFQEGNTVGINVSPMVIGLEKEKGVTLQNYIELMKYIIKNTDMHPTKKTVRTPIASLFQISSFLRPFGLGLFGGLESELVLFLSFDISFAMNSILLKIFCIHFF